MSDKWGSYGGSGRQYQSRMCQSCYGAGSKIDHMGNRYACEAAGETTPSTANLPAAFVSGPAEVS